VDESPLCREFSECSQSFVTKGVTLEAKSSPNWQRWRRVTNATCTSLSGKSVGGTRDADFATTEKPLWFQKLCRLLNPFGKEIGMKFRLWSMIALHFICSVAQSQLTDFRDVTKFRLPFSNIQSFEMSADKLCWRGDHFYGCLADKLEFVGVKPIQESQSPNLDFFLTASRGARGCGLSDSAVVEAKAFLDKNSEFPQLQVNWDISTACAVSKDKSLKCLSCQYGSSVFYGFRGSSQVSDQITIKEGFSDQRGWRAFIVTPNETRMGYVTKNTHEWVSQTNSLIDRNLKNLDVFFSDKSSVLEDLNPGPRDFSFTVLDRESGDLVGYLTPFSYQLRLSQPEFKITGKKLKEAAIGHWLRSSIDSDGNLKIGRNNEPYKQKLWPHWPKGGEQDFFPKKADQIAKDLKGSNTLRHYLRAAGIRMRHFKNGGGGWSASWADGDWVSRPRFDDVFPYLNHEAYHTPFEEITCAIEGSNRKRVHCWGIPAYYEMGYQEKPSKLVSFGVEFQADLVDFDVGGKILCGIEKPGHVRCFEFGFLPPTSREPRIYLSDLQPFSKQILEYRDHPVAELSVGFQHASFLTVKRRSPNRTEHARLFHFNFYTDGQVEESQLSSGHIDLQLRGLTAYSHHSCVISDSEKGFFCEDDQQKRPILDFMRPQSQLVLKANGHQYPPKLSRNGDVGWPIHKIETSYGVTAAVTSRGVELFKGQRGGDWSSNPHQFWVHDGDETASLDLGY
jgi:hypothetical protein